MFPKDMRTKLILPGVAFLALIFAVGFVVTRKSLPDQKPLEDPPESIYESKIAGLGIVESGSKDLNLGTQKAGLVKEIYVQEGQSVEAQAPLFLVDDRAQRAALMHAQAAKGKAASLCQEAREAWHRVCRLKDKAAVSQEEYQNRFYTFQTAKRAVQEADAEVALQTALLDQHRVTAPIAGQILRINVRLGEYAPAAQVSPPLMIMGDTRNMHVRVEIDERDVWRFKDQSPAMGILRGDNGVSVPLTFVEKSYLILPKKVLMGDGVERVDTRVLQVVYAFDNGKVGALSGQQMDVFIKSASMGDIAPPLEKSEK